jgi:hypothetical protein
LLSLIKIINYVHPIICLFRHVCCFLTIPNTATTSDNFMNNISPKRYSKCNDAKILPITTYLYQIFITPFSYLVIWFCLFCTNDLKMCYFFFYTIGKEVQQRLKIWNCFWVWRTWYKKAQIYVLFKNIVSNT